MVTRGTVKQVSERGFGFIDHGGEKDIFFHVSGMKFRQDFDGLEVGQRVEFSIDDTGERPRAVEVSPIGD